MTKEQVLFYLKRILVDYEPAPIDHEQLATKGISYEERQRIVAKFEKENPEALALHAAIETVEKFYHIKY